MSVACLLGIGATWAPRPAVESLDVSTVSFRQPLADRANVVVQVTFDQPVEQTFAAGVRDQLSAEPAITQLNVEHLTCGQEIVRTDRNGGWRIRYACFPLYAVLNWDYRLSPTARATVVGSISERGLSWWRNGVAQRQSSGHPSIPPDYLLHGVMKKVWNGDVIDYQDYITWRHNIGPGGTIAVTFAGSVSVG
jgi:hypothetical protein